MIGRARVVAAALLAALLGHAPTAGASDWTRCQIDYTLSGWSFFYRTMRGTGTVSCANGQSGKVTIVTHGGGFSFGSFPLLEGRARASSVFDIRELYGTYFQTAAHAGAGTAVDARAMLGRAGLSAAGRGRGVNVGFSFGAFTIRPR